ncbi:hypothetical protein MUA04_03935 [Enterobacteriaceae bacterium H11S18]|uniref:hypothetical protein n=1 Tax=Dryocola clanedunensis TaxID=2925396 RepID=UPI0022F038B3|nr:hypothetical protein [Dryocola clanedunensis]MCT4709339.1 hypothetical protein [Dryocola clanedunensis]
MKQYTNELTLEILASFDKPTFSDEQVAGIREEWQELIPKQQTELKQHPAIGIYRIAVEGSLTRDGGLLKTATATTEIEISNGQKLRVAQTLDTVVYPDGTEATIISGAGEAGHNSSGQSVALVGSRLSNGDEIISTPQGTAMLVLRREIPAAKGFLVDNFEVKKIRTTEPTL